jgi:hypothetical protein
MLAFLLMASVERLSAQCTAPAISCGSHVANRMDNAKCHFSDGPPYFVWSYYAVSGTVVDAFMSSNAFVPRLALYRGNSSTPITLDHPGSTITELTYDVLFSDVYYLVAWANNGSTTGAFSVDFYCDLACRAPFETQFPGFATVPYGGQATLVVAGDGTPPLAYLWYDEANPAMILSSSPTLTTPPLYATAVFHTRVSNACGSFDDRATVNVGAAPCIPPSIVGQFSDVVVPVGGTARFIAMANGSTPLSYVWHDAAEPSTSVANGADFTTPPLTRTHRYFVTVANTCGSVNSAIVAAIVQTRHRAAQH